MEHYRDEFVKFNRIKDRLEEKRREILESGRTGHWINKELAALNEKGRQELSEWNSSVQVIAEDYTVAGQDIAQEVRRKPAGKELDAPTLDLHRGLAKDAFSGRKPDEILQAFDRVVGELRGDELAAKWVYENTLRSLINDPSYEEAVEVTFDKHRTPLEKAAHKELKRRETFLAHDATIRGLAKMDVESIMAGDKPTYNDIGTLHDEMMSNI